MRGAGMKIGKGTLSLAVLLLGCVCGLAVDAAAGADTTERSEVWEGKMYSSTFRVAMCVAPDGKARGVLLLRRRSGDVDTYHFYGTERNGVIAVSHSSGHKLEARQTSPTSVQGKLRLANGMKFSFDAVRNTSGRVSDDCAPL